MDYVKFGKSTIVLNGMLKEIQTRSVAVSTEDLHKHVMTSLPSPGSYGQPFSYVIPYFIGPHMPFYYCPCQLQYFTMWQSYLINENRKNDLCYCKNMYTQQNYMNNLYFNPFMPANNSLISSCPSNHSCEELTKLEMQKASGDEFKQPIPNFDTKTNQELHFNSPTNSRRSISISTNDKPSISRIPKLSSSSFMVSNGNTEDNSVLSPKEMVEYTNQFLPFPKYRKRELIKDHSRENITSDEDPADKCFITRSTSETASTNFSRSVGRLKFLENNSSDPVTFHNKFLKKIDTKSSGDCITAKKPEPKDLNHLLKPNKNFMKDAPGYENDEIGESRQRLMGNQLFDTVPRKVPNQITQGSGIRLPGRPLTPGSDHSNGGDDVPMMMMINTLVKKHPPSNDSKLNQLLNHIEKESSIEKASLSSEAPHHRFRKRTVVQKKTSPTENLKNVKTTTAFSCPSNHSCEEAFGDEFKQPIPNFHTKTNQELHSPTPEEASAFLLTTNHR